MTTSAIDFRSLLRRAFEWHAPTAQHPYAFVYRSNNGTWIVDLEPGTATFLTAREAFGALGWTAEGEAVAAADAQHPLETSAVELAVLRRACAWSHRFIVDGGVVYGPYTRARSSAPLYAAAVNGCGRSEHPTLGAAFRSLSLHAEARAADDVDAAVAFVGVLHDDLAKQVRPGGPVSTTDRRAPVQGDMGWQFGRKPGLHAPGTIAWAEHLTAWTVYARKYGNDQSAERLAERGGFGYDELVDLLGHEPKTWEHRGR